MTSEAERRLADRGVELVEIQPDEHGGDLVGHLERNPDLAGLLALVPVEDGGAFVHAVIRPGLEEDRRALFAGWVEEKIDRFFEHGPEPDGWQRRQSDGGWQLWARQVQLPPL